MWESCESWTIKKAEHWTTDAFELWCWRRLLRVPWNARRSNQSILNEISPEYSLEKLMLKLQYFGYLMGRTDSFEKTWCWEDLKEGGEGDDRGWDGWMASPTPWTWVWASSGSWWWVRRRQWQPSPVLLPGKSHGQRILVSCSPSGREELDMTERLHFHTLEKEMATYSSILAWRIPGMGEPGRLPSMGSHRVRHDWSDLAAAGNQ